MRCGCPACGIYMVQKEQGLMSGCCCPNCLSRCNACMGTQQLPVSIEMLRTRAALYVDEGGHTPASDAPRTGMDEPYA